MANSGPLLGIETHHIIEYTAKIRNPQVPKAIAFPKGTIEPSSSVSHSFRELCQIRNLGGKLGRALADEFESSTVGDLL